MPDRDLAQGPSSVGVPLFFIAWLLFAFAATIGAPLFGRFSFDSGVDKPFPEQSQITWTGFALRAALGFGIPFELPDAWNVRTAKKWLDAVVYYGAYFLFAMSPWYFLLRRSVQSGLAWILFSAPVFLCFWLSGSTSFDSFPWTGISRPHRLWGFYWVATSMTLMAIAMFCYEYENVRRRRLAGLKLTPPNVSPRTPAHGDAP
jgi:hypothetical protein